MRRCTIVHTVTWVNYEWDFNKARANLGKHGVDFADAVLVLEDPLALTVKSDHLDEPRFATIGMDGFSRILVIIYTWASDDTIRLVSARKATSQERRQYEGGSS